MDVKKINLGFGDEAGGRGIGEAVDVGIDGRVGDEESVQQSLSKSEGMQQGADSRSLMPGQLRVRALAAKDLRR